MFYDLYLSFESLALFEELLLAVRNFNIGPILLLVGTISLISVTIHFLLFSKLKKIEFKYGTLILVMAVFGGLSLSKVHASRYDIDEQLNLSGKVSYDYNYENPLMYFFRSLPFIEDPKENAAEYQKSTKTQMLASTLMKGTLQQLPAEYAPNNYAQLILDYPGYEEDISGIHPLRFMPQSEPANDSGKATTNIILVVLESVRFEELSQELTPNLLKIAADSTWFENAYATARATVKSEQAILCSSIDGNLRTPFARSKGVYRGKCLPSILSQNGYDTIWFHGNTKEFYNRQQFHPSLGFNELVAKEEFEADGYNTESDIGWGIPDPLMYQTALQKLSARTKPFFAEILTVSSHQPFDWDYGDFEFPAWLNNESDDIYHNYRKSIYYADAALGEFWQAYQNSSLKENTIVVITGDHGVPFYPDDVTSEKEKFNILFKVPMLIHKPQASPEHVEQSLSHLDIAPTILSLLNIQDDTSFLGRPIMGKYKTTATRPIYHMNMDNYGFRYGQTECIPTANLCEAGSQCFKEKRFSCSVANPADIEIVKQSKVFMDYLQLLTEAEFVE